MKHEIDVGPKRAERLHRSRRGGEEMLDDDLEDVRMVQVVEQLRCDVRAPSESEPTAGLSHDVNVRGSASTSQSAAA